MSTDTDRALHLKTTAYQREHWTANVPLDSAFGGFVDDLIADFNAVDADRARLLADREAVAARPGEPMEGVSEWCPTCDGFGLVPVPGSLSPVAARSVPEGEPAPGWTHGSSGGFRRAPCNWGSLHDYEATHAEMVDCYREEVAEGYADLAARIATLEAENARLRAEVAALRERVERLDVASKALSLGEVFHGGGLHHAAMFDVAQACVRYMRGEPSRLDDIAARGPAAVKGATTDGE